MCFVSRPHKTDEKTTKRLIWEIYHINAGRLALVLALANITLGVFLAVTPSSAWITWLVMMCLWIAFIVFMEIRLHYLRWKTGETNVEMSNR